jgi:peptide-N4-(N-acetyl-beta-glucosaminyl)asparagine amidase
MYESGWGKKLSFVVAASTEEVTDVTMRYTRQFHTPEFQERRAAVGVSEQFVKQHLERLNQQLSFALAPYRIQFLAKRMTVQLEEFEKNNTTQPYLNLKPEELIGRISGSEEWKESRGETGGSCPTPAPLRTLKDLLHNHAVFTKVKPILSTTSTSVTDKIICLGHATKKIAASDQTTEHDFYRLTEDKGAQVGAIWYNQQLPVTSFISKFKFCMTKSGVGADGMAFVIQNHGLDAIGSDGGGKGYDGIPKSIAIEMDTYKSTGEHDDNHIAIHTRKLEKNSSDMSSAIAFTRGIHTKMSDASPHTIQVLYDHTQKELHVVIDNNLVLEKVSWDMSVLGSHVWMGFTAGTGGFHQVHDLLEWELECIRDDEYLVFFKTANVDGIAKKLNEFDAVEKKMNEEDKKTLHELLYDKQVTCNDKHYALIDKLLHYGPAHAFPVLDMLRLLLARHSTTMIKHYADQCAKNEGNLIQFMLNESPFSKVKLYANQMIMYRLLCNLFADSSAVQFLYDNQHVVLDALLDGNVWKATKNDKPPAKSAYASVLLNYSVFCTSKFEEQEIIIRLITALAEILEENKADAQESTLVNCMVALKVCLEDGEDEDGLVKGLAMSLEVDNTLTEIIKLHQDQKELVVIANHLKKLFTE